MWGTGISFSLGFGKATDELWDGTRLLGLGTLTPCGRPFGSDQLRVFKYFLVPPHSAAEAEGFLFVQKGR